MAKLLITLEITDVDVIAEYQGVHKELVYDDLRDGDLMEYCEIKSVELVNAKTKTTAIP